MSDIKLVLVGGQQVGKSSILSRFITNTYDGLEKATLGISFFSKDLNIKGKKIKVNIWDTAGQERFNSLTRLYSRDAQGIIFVFDLSVKDSFSTLLTWYETLKSQGFEENVVLAIVGNKLDLIPEQYSLEEAEAFASTINALFFRSSAKLGIGIQDLFENMCEKIMLTNKITVKDSQILETGRIKKKNCCA